MTYLTRAVFAFASVTDWLDGYLASPSWRFLLMPGVMDGQPWAGVLMPSVDRVGRYYPLTIARPLPALPADAGQAVEPVALLVGRTAEIEGKVFLAERAAAGRPALATARTAAAAAQSWAATSPADRAAIADFLRRERAAVEGDQDPAVLQAQALVAGEKFDRARAQAEGLDIAFQVADAENLPFPDGAFDVALSTFGVMFVSRPEAAAAGRVSTSTTSPASSTRNMSRLGRWSGQAG